MLPRHPGGFFSWGRTGMGSTRSELAVVEASLQGEPRCCDAIYRGSFSSAQGPWGQMLPLSSKRSQGAQRLALRR